MRFPKRQPCVAIHPNDLAEVTRRYEAGLYLQAYDLAKTFAPLDQWGGTEGKIIAGRLAKNLGAQRMGRWIHAAAYREARSHPEAIYYYGTDWFHYRGPYAAWRFFEKLDERGPITPSSLYPELMALRANIAAQFRDFERSDAFLDRAMEKGAAIPWVWCEKASCLRCQDAFAEALDAAREALRLQPWFRPAVQIAADLLQSTGEDRQALDLLAQALGHIESGAVAAQLADIQIELGLYRDALGSLKRASALHPLADQPTTQWWHARMSDALYRCGDLERSADHARQAGSEFHRKFADRISAPGATPCRVQLPVGFVQQHHMTCVPATLSAVSRFWNMPVDHAALAKAICYEGTPGHVERHWAEENGYAVREFRVTWEIAAALIDRGVPFTLTTTETASAHLQAVIGYDALRRTLLIRNPGDRIFQEYEIGPLLERYAPFGPRGMALVPEAEARRLEGLDFPDLAFHNLDYALQRALFVHDRAAAETALAAMNRLDPGHRLTLFARRELAFYDGSFARQQASAEELLAKYPTCNNFRWSKLLALRQASRHSEYADFLREVSSGKDSEPIFWREQAFELDHDARNHASALRYALLALRHSPCDADNLATLAHLLWNERELARATDLYRFAACLNGAEERFARSWFIAAGHLRKTDEALAWLKRRFERTGGRSAQPGITLFKALSMLERTPEAFETLEAALSLRPGDGELLLFAADAFARYGNGPRAEALLGTAEKKAARIAWLRTCATLADYRSDKRQSLEVWKEIVGIEPLTMDAQTAMARLIAELEGRAAALAYLRGLCERFSFHVPLHRLLLEWMRDEPAPALEARVRQTLELDPNDAWVRRELALVLSRQRRFDEALAEADEAMRIEPANAVSATVRAQVLLDAGRRSEARAAAREALALSIDAGQALNLLINAADRTEEKREDLAFVRSELVRQVVFGDGLLAYRAQAYAILEPAELLADLREALAARPDLWHAGSAVVQQLVDMRQYDEALALARQAVGKFPLLPRVWCDLALVHWSKRERAEEIAAYERALQLNPSWGVAVRGVAAARRDEGDFDAAGRMLERAIASEPLDPVNHAGLAEVLWMKGEREEALGRMEHAVALDPGYDWGWEALASWSREMGTPDRAEKCARALIEARPGEARSWFRLAQSLPPASREESLAALDKAVALNPRFIDALDKRAVLLAEAGRFDEALTLCSPSPSGEPVHMALQGRAAAIDAMRGDMVTAIKKMRTVVEAFPDYYWGWTRLAEWLAAKKDYPAALEITVSMARLAPRSAIPLGYRADIQARMGRQKEALETLRRAFEIDPTYDFAAYTIFDAQIRSRDFAEAEKTLNRIERYLPGAKARAARVRLLCHQNKEKLALKELRVICFLPERDAAAVEMAVSAFAELQWRRPAEHLLEELLDEDGVNPEVGAQWVKLFCARGKWALRSTLYQLDPESELGRRAFAAFLNETGLRHKPQYLKRLISRFGKTLRKDTRCWGFAGYSYVSNGRFKEGAKWLGDWRQRPEAKPWMLHNTAMVLRIVGKPGEALEVNRAALRLCGDQTTSEHALWVACEEAIAGRVDAARELFSTVTLSELGPQPKTVHALTAALIEVQAAEPGARRAVYDQQKRLLRKTPEGQLSSPTLRPTAKRAIYVMAKASGARPFRIPGGSREVNWRKSWYWIPAAFFILSSALRSCGPANRPSSLPPPPPPVRHHSANSAF